MHIVGVNELQAPHRCFVSEQAPTEDARFVDTLSNFHVGGTPDAENEHPVGPITHLSGRKYISEDVVVQAALLFGWVSPADYAQVVAERDEAEERLLALAESTASAVALERAVLGSGVTVTPEEVEAVALEAHDDGIVDEDEEGDVVPR